jgi:hypothetical protein
VALLLLVAGVLVVRRHEAINWVLPRLLSLATGYSISIDDQRLGATHGALIGVHVSKHGDPVLDADRIDIWYNGRDLLPGSGHRYGVNAIAVDHPRLTIVRHSDGGYNITFPRAETPGLSAPTYRNLVPINLTVRVANGSGSLRSPAALDKDSRNIEVVNVNADAGINSAFRTHYTIAGAFLEDKPQPFLAKGAVDEERGFASHHMSAAVVPLRAIANFFINSKAAQILAGTARNFEARYYALDVEPGKPTDYHISGQLDVSDAAMHIVGLAKPLEHIIGRLQIVDDTFFATGLAATLAGSPVVVSGGIFAFGSPQFRLGLATQGDLKNLREVFTFAHNQPVSGLADVSAVIEGPLSSPIVLAQADAPHAVYRGIPLESAHAAIAFAHSSVTIAPLIAHIGAARFGVRGTLAIGDSVHSELAVHVDGRAESLPYAGELLGTEPMLADGLLDGTGTNFRGYGALASARGIDRAAAVVHVEPTGSLDVEPLWSNVGTGTFAAAYHLNRATNESAFWVNASNLHLRAPSAGFPSGVLPTVPAIDGTIDALALEGGGPTGIGALVAGDVRAHDATIAGVKVDALQARFAGHLSDAAVDPVVASGPWGSLTGTGALSTSALALQGAYHGSLQGLRAYLNDPTATGEAAGNAAIVISKNGITVQAQDIALRDASVHGLPVATVRGTFGVQNGTLRVYSGHADMAGGDVVAAGTTKTGVALIANHIDGADLRSVGLPIDAGVASLAGSVIAASSLAQYSGGFALANGRSGPYDVAGTGNVAMHGTSAHLEHIVGSLDGNVALARGDIDAITSGAPQYAMHANIPAGDVTRTLDMFALPTLHSDGTYNASLDIGGRGTDPQARGQVNVPAGSVNGLPFIDASTRIRASREGVSAGRGNVLVGTTAVAFFAAQNPRISGLRIRAPHTQLADFNNFFDTGDTLRGAGTVRFNVFSQSHRISSNGGIDVHGLEYRDLPIGDTRASWTSAHSLLTGNLVVGGAEGLLRAGGSIQLTPSPQFVDIIRTADYHVKLDFDRLNTSTWLAEFGFPQIPLAGRMDADAHIDGRYPALSATGTASLSDGSIWRLPIESADLAFSTVKHRMRIDSGSLVAPGLTATAQGSLGFAPPDPLALEVYLNSDDVPLLMTQLYRVNVPIKGEFESTISIGGSFAKPTFAAAFDATNAEAYGVKIPSVFGSARWNKNAIELRNAGVQFERGDIALAGTLPLVLDPFGVGPQRAPLSLNLALNGLAPSVFDALFGAHTHLGGSIDGVLAVAGTIGTPRIYGRFALTDGSYVSDYERKPITKAAATLTFDRTQASVDGLTARLGNGRVDGKGHVALSDTGGAAFNVQATAKDAQLDLPALGSGSIDGVAVLSRITGEQAKLSGAITLHDATLPFSAFLSATQGGNSAPLLPFPVALGFDMNLAAGKNVRVRGGGLGAGLDIGAVGAAHLAGTLASPTLAGRFASTSGTLTYFDRAFRVREATVTFDPTSGIIPDLHAVGTTHVTSLDPTVNPGGSTNVTIAVDGPINGLKIAFSSDPSGYSNEQIIAMIAPFGGLIASSSSPGSGAFKQEAFNILNAQFTAGLLAPIESALSTGLGFSDVNLNVDYYGNVGFSATRLLGRTIDFVYSQTFGLPVRQSVGLQLRGAEATSAQLTFYWTTGPTRLFETPINTSALGRLSIGQPAQGSGFAFTLQRLYW